MAVLALAAVTGCTQTPKTVDEVIAGCVRKVHGWQYGWQIEAAQLMRVSREKMPELFCKRIVTAVQQGRLSSKDAYNLDRAASPVWKIIKGQ
ncbi:hypothetical protein [Kumtagia ephedrae]|jgi:hypothetical protein|uniref:Uncharacterized protein n=1 Tax=Kumtagia ephedrae TaxID=2116701 RepID=A0A2P7RJU8_9HYPH|nr:hypothetical protein [Mesorhizobium ephedrae]PSJ50493.1 hypothetical protein C7I84_28450 [Mesorhizobium ephedrae]